jgi:hypothetical protein
MLHQLPKSSNSITKMGSLLSIWAPGCFAYAFAHCLPALTTLVCHTCTILIIYFVLAIAFMCAVIVAKHQYYAACKSVLKLATEAARVSIYSQLRCGCLTAVSGLACAL